jgi:hypothetical protein
MKEIEEHISKVTKMNYPYFSRLTEESQKELLVVLKRFWIYCDNSPVFKNSIDKQFDWFRDHFRPVFK